MQKKVTFFFGLPVSDLFGIKLCRIVADLVCAAAEFLLKILIRPNEQKHIRKDELQMKLPDTDLKTA